MKNLLLSSLFFCLLAALPLVSMAKDSNDPALETQSAAHGIIFLIKDIHSNGFDHSKTNMSAQPEGKINDVPRINNLNDDLLS